MTSIADSSPTPAGRSGRGYFAVGLDTFHKATALGLNPGCVFLVLARGSGPDDVTTAWSAEAAAKRLGIRWQAAKTAIEDLRRAKLVITNRGSTRPAYTLAKKGDVVTLPNALIEGVAGELSPVRRVRQMQDPLTLRLFVDLYAVTDLPGWGGIDPGVVRAEFTIERAGERGAFTAWRFEEAQSWLTWGAITTPHRLEPGSIPDGSTVGSAFWQRFRMLQRDGLIQLVPMVCEGEEGEALFPMTPDTDVPQEAELFDMATSAGALVAPEWADDYNLVPLPHRVACPVVRGIYRLRYRPHTAPTRVWYAEHVRNCATYQRDFERIVEGDTSRNLRFGTAIIGSKANVA